MKLTREVEEVKNMNVMTIYSCDWWDLQNVWQQVAEYYSVKQNWNNFFFLFELGAKQVEISYLMIYHYTNIIYQPGSWR